MTNLNGLKIGKTMAYATHDAIESDAVAQAWMLWAQQNGIKAEISMENYYNLPNNRVDESMHDEPKRSENWFEIRTDLNDYPEIMPTEEQMEEAVNVHGANESAVAAAVSSASESHAKENAVANARRERAADLLGRAKQIVPASIGTGTRMGDSMYDVGGECRELLQMVQARLVTLDQVRDAIRS